MVFHCKKMEEEEEEEIEQQFDFEGKSIILQAEPHMPKS